MGLRVRVRLLWLRERSPMLLTALIQFHNFVIFRCGRGIVFLLLFPVDVRGQQSAPLSGSIFMG